MCGNPDETLKRKIGQGCLPHKMKNDPMDRNLLMKNLYPDVDLCKDVRYDTTGWKPSKSNLGTPVVG